MWVNKVQSHDKAPYSLAIEARRSLTLKEQRFYQEVKKKWPALSWRRYAPVTIQTHPEHKSTWFAPFLCIARKLVVVMEERKEFPYTISGRNLDLYARHGYTVLDFTEDGGEPWDDQMWADAMSLVKVVLH